MMRKPMLTDMELLIVEIILKIYMYDDEDGLVQACREKKRRLNMEQVKTFEKNFELGNKLEPDRKLQLARSLGLQPRRIAIWFQNRKARWKTKQLEKDYELLRVHFDAAKAENDSLQSQNQKLHAQILALKNREPTEFINLNKETEGSCSNRSDENNSDINLDISRRALPAVDSHPNITSSRSTLLFPSTDSDTKRWVRSTMEASGRRLEYIKLDEHALQNRRSNWMLAMVGAPPFQLNELLYSTVSHYCWQLAVGLILAATFKF